MAKIPWYKHPIMRKWFFVSISGLLSIWVIPLLIMQFIDPKTIPDEPKLILQAISSAVFLFGFIQLVRWQSKLKDVVQQDYWDK